MNNMTPEQALEWLDSLHETVAGTNTVTQNKLPEAQAAIKAFRSALSANGGEMTENGMGGHYDPRFGFIRNDGESVLYATCPECGSVTGQCEEGCPENGSPSVAVPDGWLIRRADDRIIVQHHEIGGYRASKDGDSKSGIAETILYHLADAMLSAAPPPVAVPEEKGFADAPPELDNNEAVAWVNGYHQCRDDMLSAAPQPATQNVDWFFYDAENGNIEICETKEEALSKAQKAVDFCFDECWSDDVEQICVGIITHRAKQTDLMFKPQKLDEDMFSEDGEHWPEDCESKCDYSIEPIDPQPQGGGE